MKIRTAILGVLGGGLLLAIVWLGVRVEERARVQTLTLQAYAGDTNAGQTLREMGHEAVPGLLAQAQYQISPERKALSRKAAALPQPIGRIIGPILGLPNDVQIREAAARAFGSGDYEAHEAVPILIYLLSDPEANVRWEAAKSLSTYGEAAIPPLVEILTEKTNTALSMAAYTMGQIGVAAGPAAEALLAVLTDSNPEVRSQAAYALTQLGPDAAVALANLSARGTPAEQQISQDILRRMRSSQSPPIVMLRQLATDAAVTNRVRAMEALGNLNPATSLAVRALIEGLSDPEADVRVMAAQSLGTIGPRARLALPGLEVARNDAAPSVRAAVERAREQIQATQRPAATSD